MNFSAAHAYCPRPKPSRAWGVVVGVLVLHGVVIWAVHGGLRHAAQAPKLTVVAARLILQPSPAPSLSSSAAPALVAPLPPATPAAPQPTPLARPQATVPAEGPSLTPVPTSTPVLAAAASSAPAFSAPPAPVTPAASSTLSAPGGPSASTTASASAVVAPAGTTAAAAHGPTAPARVAAALQASGTCAKPAYPELSRRREEQGSVQLKFLIAADGHVVESKIEQSSGYPRLDEAARAALSKCQFKPGTVDGKPEPSWASIKYTWRLEL